MGGTGAPVGRWEGCRVGAEVKKVPDTVNVAAPTAVRSS